MGASKWIVSERRSNSMFNLFRYPKDLRRRIAGISAALDVIADNDHLQCYADGSTWAVSIARFLHEIMLPLDGVNPVPIQDLRFHPNTLAEVIAFIERDFLNDIGKGKTSFEAVDMSEEGFHELFKSLKRVISA
jgi:hypothetical protein